MEYYTRESGAQREEASQSYRIMNGCSAYNYFTSTGTLQGNYWVTKGCKIPDFYRRKTRGELLPMTVFSSFKATRNLDSHYEIAYKPSACTGCSGTKVTYEFTGYLGTSRKYIDPETINDVPFDLWDPSLIQSSAAKIVNSGWDALTFAAELGKTIEMLSHFARRLAELIASGQFTKIWLEGRYGWRTLVFDIQDISLAIANLDEGRKRFKALSTNDDEHDVQTVDHFDLDYHYYDILTTRSWAIKRNATIVADITPPKIQFDPIQTALELIPYSFVVDWVLNVSKWLGAMKFLALASKYTAANGALLTLTTSCIIANTGYKLCKSPNYWNSGTHTASAVSSATWKLRHPTSMPLLPQLSVHIDGYKLLDAVALLWQAWSRHKPKTTPVRKPKRRDDYGRGKRGTGWDSPFVS